MKILIQECKQASVTIAGEVISSIGSGEVIFVGFTQGDSEALIDKMISKLLKLRIFPDSEGKTNLSLDQVSGELLVVSQFTLYADVTGGNRPSFVKALKGDESQALYNYFVEQLKKQVKVVKTGVFGADMKVSLINDGPFTILLDSQELYHE